MDAGIKNFLQNHCANKNIFIGFSGGLDSHVLLHLTAKYRFDIPFNLFTIHVNHNLNLAADQWQIHCEKITNDLNIKFFSEKLIIVPNDDLENQLRIARYKIFKKYLQKNDILLTAHQQNDQAETILLQMLRGAGPKGLSAMPLIKSFGQGQLARPLLNCSRNDLLQYAIKNNLNWIEDDSNQDTKFSRNFLRHKIFPTLIERWPAANKTLSRVAEHCAEQEKLLAEYIEQDLNFCVGTKVKTLSVKKLMQINEIRRKAILRSWIGAQQFQMPPSKKLHEITTNILTASCDRQPYLTWDNVEIRRYRDDLYIMQKLAPHDASQIIQGEIPGKTIRFRQGGEKILLPGRAHHHCLKKVFQEQGIPPWLRDRIPLIYQENELIGFVVE